MDSLKTLMDQKNYELVIKLTENSNDAIALFYRLSALLAVGQSEEALNLIKTKRLILQKRLSLLIKFHIEILCLLKRFDEAYDELRYYEELPYESQEVEELLKQMPGYIRKEEKANYRPPLDEDELKEKLLCKNDEDVLAALDQIKNLPINKYLINIMKITKTHPRQIIRSFALLVLVNQKYEKSVPFLHYGKIINVIPKELDDPFKVPGYSSLEEFSFALQSAYHDPSIANNALNIISSYLLFTYPDKLDLTPDESLVIFGYLAKKLLKINIDDLDTVCLEKGLDYSKIVKRMEDIEIDLNNF